MDAKPNASLVRDFMIHPVITVPTNLRLWQVAELFIAKKISGAPVVDNAGSLISVIGEGLILRLAAKEGLDATIAHCLASMPSASEIITVRPEESFANAYKLFLKHNLHRIPVTDANGKLLGLLSRSGILRIFVEAHYGRAIRSS